MRWRMWWRACESNVSPMPVRLGGSYTTAPPGVGHEHEETLKSDTTPVETRHKTHLTPQILSADGGTLTGHRTRKE